MFLVLVAWELGLTSEFLRVLVPLFEALAEGFPGLLDLDQNGIGNFPGEGLIAFQMLYAMEDFRVWQIFSLMDVGLSNLIRGLIVKVFGSKSSGINGLIA